MSFLTDLFSGGAGKLVDSVGNVLDKVITTKQEVMQQELELKKAEMQYRLDERRLDIEEQKTRLADIDSARTRSSNIETSANATLLSKNITSFLAIGSTVLTFALFYIIIFRNEVIKAEVKDVVLYVLGVLSAIITQVFSFYFGSSQGSVDKNKIIEGIKK
ncbi:hypothetical protein [Microbacter margulisiae]|uniref:Uncharacterized protein n=1 Tax=Microbacter margulisiae TaxID=1350067 RepID=A0A7W5DSM3_9PORP|nr:hypothetical protein [Microbacter margulisiae]MBB3187839.1 hypothetical protein [Microbacter margulisiae]